MNNPRPLTTRADRAAWMDNNHALTTLVFKWSSGAYGHRVRLQDKHGNTWARCSGGGYDMQGTALGDFIAQQWPDVVRRMDSRDFYGVTHFCKRTRRHLNRAGKHTQTTVNGGCGFNSMRRILARVGFTLCKVYDTPNVDVYTLQSL